MRQTSRAVALLLALESANAAQTFNQPVVANVAFNTNNFNPAASAEGAPTNTLQLNSRTAGYMNANPLGTNIVAGATWGTLAIKKGIIADTSGAVTTSVGSGCMACLNKNGVWCSRTFSYLSTSETFQNDNTANSGIMATVNTTQKNRYTGAALDAGSCCEDVTNFTKFVQTMSVGYISASHTAYSISDSASAAMVGESCVAVAQQTNTYLATTKSYFGADRNIDATTTAFSGWWCSNGLYKQVKSAGAGNIILNAQQIIPNGQNKRLELAQVGCPNATKMCGYGFNATKAVTNPIVATELKAGATSWVVAMPLSGMTVNNKCTWVVWSTLSAPTFTLQNTLLTGTKGLATSNWQIHAMEYTAGVAGTYNAFDATKGTLVAGVGATGFNTAVEALAGPQTLTPLFTMPAEQFATLRTWYGEGQLKADETTLQQSSWLSPGTNPLSNTTEVSKQLAATQSQLYGNVANIPVSNNIVNDNTNDLGDFNYGSYNKSKPFDLRQVRYFPAKVAQTNWKTGSDALAKYNGILSTYKTALTTWDNYVAILEKNAAQDAFAALFSPPKAPTVPPLPNKPWLPAAYSGYVRATQLDQVSWANNFAKQTKVASPNANQFWTSIDAAQTVGGWGSFTAQIFIFRNGWGKSFGTIGYSGDANKLNMSDVWNYKWQCIADQTKDAALPAGSQCAPSYTATAGSAATANATTLANTVKMVTAVSLWSTANKSDTTADLGWTKNDFAITFSAGAWKSAIVGLTPIASPEQATDAKSLSGLAGAQALVASGAAALAVAAALY